jgi:hypothetical protein
MSEKTNVAAETLSQGRTGEEKSTWTLNCAFYALEGLHPLLRMSWELLEAFL